MRLDPEIRAILDRVVARTAQVRGITAIALGGSRARGTADRHSDIDLGLYYDSRRPFRIADLARAARDLDDRHAGGLLTRFGEWGPGVNGGGWLQVGGMHVDFLYRDLVAVRRTIADCRAGRVSSLYQLGHPMGFHSQIYAGEVNCCVLLHDPRAALHRLKRMVARYPEPLRRALVTKHFFDATFELVIAGKPAKRDDTAYVAGCMFRAAGFMTLVLYALNRQWLINEKGALAASRGFKVCPRGFHATIASVMAKPGDNPRALARSLARMRSLAAALRATAARHGIEVTGFGF
ncbi:MAG TPA: nucleotidyltransferase domain-containing protein [Candidatus Binataceae bacterium]|nr:nucleotidyltransferase domain-containing protein [Candidatus Binataceae bacterium]